VANGYVQRQGIDFEEVFAPVARIESIRVILCLAAHIDWTVHHMDVKSSFLNGDLAEEVYGSQPPGFIKHGQESNVLKVHKAMYGLRQAQRAWISKLDSMLNTLGFAKCRTKHGLYTRVNEKQRLIVCVYVDDLIILGKSTKVVKLFKQEMKKVFHMSDLGVLSYYLGIEVRQGLKGIELCQSAYAGKLLEKARMICCNPCAVPMEPKLKLSKEGNSSPVDQTEYQSLIGSLRYLLHTQPELTFSVSYLSRFMEKPHVEHMAAVKHLLHYVAGTLNYGLFYPRREGGSLGILGYSDSDMGGDVDDIKSTSGMIFFLGSNLATWNLQKQRVVALP
jgi:hypothetical protein